MENACSCGRGQVEYKCVKQECMNYQKQSEYCRKCMEKFTNHAHNAVRIDELQVYNEVIEKWSQLKSLYETIFNAARPEYKPMKPLIAFFESIKQ